jgi:hypothetical protein
VTPLDDQLSVALCPRTMVAGETLIARLGLGGGSGAMGRKPAVLNEQLKKEEA